MDINDVYGKYLRKVITKLYELKEQKKLTIEDILYVREDLDKIEEMFVCAHDYVLLDDDYIYEINIFYTYDFGACSSGGEEYIVKDNKLYVQRTYTSPDYDDLQFTEPHYLGKIIRRSNFLEDLIDVNQQIQKIDKVLYKVIK